MSASVWRCRPTGYQFNSSPAVSDGAENDVSATQDVISGRYPGAVGTIPMLRHVGIKRV